MKNVGDYKWVRLTETGAVSASKATVMGAMVFSVTASTEIQPFTLALTNDTDGSGTSLINLSTLAGSTQMLDLTPFGGIPFDTAIYGTLANSGTGSLAYVIIDG